MRPEDSESDPTSVASAFSFHVGSLAVYEFQQHQLYQLLLVFGVTLEGKEVRSAFL